MNLIAAHIRAVTERAMHAAYDIAGLTVYGPPPGKPRSPLVAFNLRGVDPLQLAERLNEVGVESRAGCHCATLAHHDLGLTPPASCPLSFALYTSTNDVDRAMDALRRATKRCAATAARARQN
jgi:cysteine desulfurase/selenocysteine lyase